MRRALAVIFAVALVAGLGSKAEAASSRKRKGTKGRSAKGKKKFKARKVNAESLMHGPDIWSQVEAKLERDEDGKVIYRENEALDEENSRQAALSQTREAPLWQEAGPEGAIYPLVMEDVVDSFIGKFKEALPILDVDDEDEITAEGLEDLRGISRVLLLRSGELVKVYATFARERRLKDEGRLKIDPELHRGKVEESILAATEEWLEVVERIEMSAMRLRRGALMRSPVRLRNAWKALVAAGLELPHLRSSIQKLQVDRKRKRKK